MRCRGSSSVLTIVVAAAAGLLVAAVLSDVVVIDIRTAPPDDVRIKLPVPLGLVRMAAALVPARELEVELPREARHQRETLEQALRALAECPDGVTLVSVRSPDARVTITKERGQIVLDVDADDAKVHGALPLDGLHDALQRWRGDRLDSRAVLDLLAAARRGPILTVESHDAVVRIAAW